MLFGGVSTGLVTAAAAAVTAVSVLSGCAPETGDGGTAGRSLVTSTTKIVDAGVLGNDRRPDESCAPEPAAAESGGARQVRNADGTEAETAEVPADPERIVVLAGGQLDALCALGLQERIVAAALPDGSEEQPSYLGTVVHDVPGAGDRSSPDLAGIAETHPDLILGSQALTPQLYGRLAAIAPTVFTGAPGATWQDNLRMVGDATGRADAAGGLVDEFADQAAEFGAEHDATHYQTSIVQLTEDTMRVYGTANFPASVLTAVGLGRPASQRFTDKPYLEVDTADLARANFSVADADIVYVSFASPAAKYRASSVLDSDAWRRLSANQDNRVFIVNNEVWQAGRGVIAASGILDDLSFVDAPIN